MIDFIIPIKAVSWNVFYSGKHWTVRSALKNDWYVMTRDSLHKAAQTTRIKTPIRIVIESYAIRPLDADNCASGKFIIDTIKRYYGIDDDPTNIPEVTFRSFKSKKEFIKVEIHDYNRTS